MFESPKILIAEDDDLYLRVLTKHLQNENYEVLIARNGNEAFEKAVESIPDLVISDWMMPEMSGEEFCKALKQHEDLKWSYFIMVTSKDKVEDLVMGLEGGADDFLTKPFDPKELMARVRTGLRIVALQRENVRLQRIDAINQTAITANHEINNPLQTILSSAQLVLDRNVNLDNVTKDSLQKIIDNVQRIRKVTMKLENMIESVSREYIKDGPQMIDLDQSITKESKESE